MATRTVPALAAGASSSGETAVTIPVGTASGSYYLVAYADAAEAVTESNNSNNQTASALQVTGGSGGSPDLVVSAFTGPGTAAVGATVSLDETTKNQGTGDTTVS